MRGIAILVAMVVSGCSLATPGEVFRVESGERGFTDAEMVEMQAEADRLCELTDGGYCPELTRGKSPNVVRKVADLPGRALGKTRLLQDYSEARAIIEIEAGIDSVSQAKTWRHELGHAGGCLTHLEAGNVMADDTALQPETWTDDDIACADRRY